jgi:hypothetical protein
MIKNFLKRNLTMTTRHESSHHVVYEHEDGAKDVWEKNSAGITTEEGHTTVNESGNITDHYGNIVGHTDDD